ncbi:helix-turn-helix transcriptional regulator [Robbsia andropogonis]|uniref:helix-turn-helix transcriptional regulator n=1 Tax=Robbsia andropogonis TaxID=28092 RepID=UPI002A6A75B4|nr:helix-turn-helix transcriptional regulator [Robbsia andropogonis]
MYTDAYSTRGFVTNKSVSKAMVIACMIGGTGSVFALSHVKDWSKMVDSRVPYFDVQTADPDPVRLDIRSAAEHLANIRQVLNPAIADLAMVFGVSRQAIYKWIGGDTTPEPENLERIGLLSAAADAFKQAEVTRASSLLKMKAFEGRSLLDLVAAGQLLPEHTQMLITEAQAMDAAYSRSGLAKSKAAQSDDWLAELSIPGSPD